MNTQSAPVSENVTPTPRKIRGPEIGSALKRDLLLQRVRAARKRLTSTAGALPRLR